MEIRSSAATWIRAGVLASVVLLAPAAVAKEAALIYKDARAPVEARVEDLLARMTLEEKIAQITTVWNRKKLVFNARDEFDPAKARTAFPGGIGQVARPSDLRGATSPMDELFRDEARTVELVNSVQRYAAKTRLGIPVLFHEEGLHGYAARGTTHFPQAIALASSWDPDLLTRVFTIVAREIRARGAHMVLAPVVDVARDPRWGRIEETYGEDPFLVGELGVAAVRGFQGETLPLAPGKVFATLKHMTGHGQPESGTNVGPAAISERVLREIFFPPFQAAIQRANALNVMASYNEIDGLPSHANRWLLTDILRGEMGFKGAVVSDYRGIEELHELHQIAPDFTAAAVRSLHAGVDFDLPDGDSFSNLPKALADGRVQQSDIDNAVRRMLRLKFLAGLFENPYADARYAKSITANAEADAMALEAARKTLVLLKNDGALPLRATALRTLAVIGPNAAIAQLGGYSVTPKHAVTLLDGITARAGKQVRVVTSEGVRLTDKGDWWSDEVVLANPQENRARITAAVQVAKEAEVIVLAIGASAALHREAWDKKHMGDSTDMSLVAQQDELANALFALGKPVITVLINGQPLSIPQIVEKSSAVLEAWYPGQEGGTALAEALFGDINPGGKLPVTIAKSVGQLPMYYNQKPSAHRGYIFDSKEPLFPFGFGLSYTTFDIGAPKLSSAKIAANGSVTASVEVRNTGKVAGDEVVQIYVHDLLASVTRPVKELKAFKRVTLAPGASQTVDFVLDAKAFAFWNEAMKFVVEPGEFTISSGGNSAELKSTTLVIE